MDDPTPPVTKEELETVTSADGTEIAFQRTGSGPPLVLVYGNGDVHEFWEGGGVRSALAEDYTVYAVERRGRGESGDGPEGDAPGSRRESRSGHGDVAERDSAGRPDAPGDGFGLEREAEDVAAVVEAIDEPATLLGHSGGALYSLEAALLTDNLRRLVLYEPPIQVGGDELDVTEEVAEIEALVDRGENERALVLFECDIAGIPLEELDALRSAPIWWDMVAAARTLPRELRSITEYEFDATRFAAVATPTLLLSGGESPPLYRDATRAVRDALPNSRIVSFEGEGHMAMHTAPDRFVDEVRSFVRGSN